MTEESKSKIIWRDDEDFGKVCTLTESALNGIINEATKKLEKENAKAKELLKQFLEAKNGEDTYKAEWEAEQFLKGE